MVAIGLWGWLQQWKHRHKPIWAAPLWQGITARVENTAPKVCHAHMPKNHTTEEHQNNEQVDKAVKIEVDQMAVEWERKGELFVAQWIYAAWGLLGRDAAYRWTHDQGVDLTM